MSLQTVYLTLDKIFLTYALNLVAYALALGLLFTILTLAQTRSIRSLNVLGKLNLLSFSKFTVLLGLLSLSGIPPLLGFFAKLFIFFALIMQANYILVGTFLIFNLFALYFYLQATRHLAQSNLQKAAKITAFRTLMPSVSISV